VSFSVKWLLANATSTRLPKVIPRFTYLGASAKIEVMDQWLGVVKHAKVYADATAGSNNQPFMVGSTLGVPVLVNDASYYSHCIAQGLFHRTKKTNLKLFAQTLVDAVHDCNPEGIFTTTYLPGSGTIPTKVGSFVDGLVDLLDQRFDPPHACFLKACIGVTIMTWCSFRSIQFSGKAGLTTKVFAAYAFNRAVANNHFHTPGEASYGDLRKFIETAPFKGASVNFDPAWPFALKRKAPTNPYHFYTRVGDVLRQKIQKPTLFWKDPSSSKPVAHEFAGWVDICLTRGAKEVFAWNQDSNLPSEKFLVKILTRHFKVKKVLSVEKNRIIGGKVFVDYVLRLRPKRSKEK